MLTIDPQDIQAKYLTKKDSKKRVTAESHFEHFEVSILKDGTLVFSPRVLIDPHALSDDIAKQIRESLDFLAQGKVGKTVDIDAGQQALRAFKTRKLKAKT